MRVVKTARVLVSKESNWVNNEFIILVVENNESFFWIG